MAHPYHALNDLPEDDALPSFSQHTGNPATMRVRPHPQLKAWCSTERYRPQLQIGSVICFDLDLCLIPGTFVGEVVGLGLTHRLDFPVDVYLRGRVAYSEQLDPEDYYHLLLGTSSLAASPRFFLSIQHYAWKLTTRFLRTVPPLQDRPEEVAPKPSPSLDCLPFTGVLIE